jgi:hypothetical protein
VRLTLDAECSSLMEESERAPMVAVVAIMQTVLHYIGWAAIVFGIAAFGFGNTDRSKALLVSGVVLLVLKFASGFVFVTLIQHYKKPGES